jgi:hypothetical protein
LTTDFSLRHVVVFAVFQCGGDSSFVDTEDVAVAANKLAPGRLTWRKYPDQINLELVRVYLSDAKKSANGILLLGTGVKGWRLSAQGLQWVRDNHEAFERAFESKLLSARPQRSGSVTNTRTQRERERLCATQAWKKWASDARSEVTLQEASEVFRIDSYASENLVDIKIGRLQQMFADDEQLAQFINFAHQALKAANYGNR